MRSSSQQTNIPIHKSGNTLKRGTTCYPSPFGNPRNAPVTPSPTEPEAGISCPPMAGSGPGPQGREFPPLGRETPARGREFPSPGRTPRPGAGNTARGPYLSRGSGPRKTHKQKGIFPGNEVRQFTGGYRPQGHLPRLIPDGSRSACSRIRHP